MTEVSLRLDGRRLFACDCGRERFARLGEGAYKCEGCGATWLRVPAGRPGQQALRLAGHSTNQQR